jgi:translation elongation factor P/translation initiation factor 5A
MIQFTLTTGGRINSHEGNVRFREIIQIHKKEYLSPATKKLEKAHIAKRIVDYIRNMNPPGRFLKEDTSDGFWYDIGDGKALKKV